MRKNNTVKEKESITGHVSGIVQQKLDEITRKREIAYDRLLKDIEKSQSDSAPGFQQRSYSPKRRK